MCLVYRDSGFSCGSPISLQAHLTICTIWNRSNQTGIHSMEGPPVVPSLFPHWWCVFLLNTSTQEGSNLLLCQKVTYMFLAVVCFALDSSQAKSSAKSNSVGNMGRDGLKRQFCRVFHSCCLCHCRLLFRSFCVQGTASLRGQAFTGSLTVSRSSLGVCSTSCRPRQINNILVK